MVTAAIGAGANLILNALLILLMGLHGAALSGLISFLIIFILRAADTRRMIRMDLKLPKMLANSVILLLMSLVIFFADNLLFYYLALTLLFGLIVLLNYQCGLMAVRMILKKKADFRADRRPAALFRRKKRSAARKSAEKECVP